MKPLAFLSLLLVLLLSGCGKSTDTVSRKFATLAEKQEFLERYVNFRRTYEGLHFNLSYIDGNSGMVPGPTEWDVRVLAVVPAGELDDWIDELSLESDPELNWVSDIPNAPSDLTQFEWYISGRVTAGIDRENRRVLYRNHAF